MISTLLLAALTVLPADRLAMADRLFNRGKYAEAKAEYTALSAEESIAKDELLYRAAECERALGGNDMAKRLYRELYERFPNSRHADHSRFMCAMGETGDERIRLLRLLDGDRVRKDVRATALYHLGVETGDAAILDRCVKIDPEGRYAVYATLKRATILTNSKDAGDRRKGVELLLSVAFGKQSELADEALYLAAVQSYREAKYGEASSLFRRYQKLHPTGGHAEDVKVMSIWSDFMNGHYADAEAACGAGKTDDLAYIRAACAYSTGDTERALKLFKQYLADFPNGRYRADAELPIARIEFDKAEKSGNGGMAVESAKRGFGLSKRAADELRLAWAYEKSGKTDAAIAEYVETAKRFSGTEEAAEALYRKAMIEARAENWSAADLSLAEALASGKIGERKASALYWRGVSAMQLGHEEEAVKFLKEAEKTGLSLDESREARLMVATYDLKTGRLEEAKAGFVRLVREGACERMPASQLLTVGKFLSGDDAAACARVLVRSESPEWRQAGYSLLGAVEENRQAFSAAIDAYRKCLAEPAKVNDLALAALHLGLLEARAGELDKSDISLKRAVELNGPDPRARATAYVALAKNSEKRGDHETAKAYATVVVSLFDDKALCDEARRILGENATK